MSKNIQQLIQELDRIMVERMTDMQNQISSNGKPCGSEGHYCLGDMIKDATILSSWIASKRKWAFAICDSLPELIAPDIERAQVPNYIKEEMRRSLQVFPKIKQRLLEGLE